MRAFRAITVVAGALCVLPAPAYAGDQVILIGRITVKASTSALAGGQATTHPATTIIAMPKPSGAQTSIFKKPDLRCEDLVVHVYASGGAPIKTVIADDLPGGLCHYQASFYDFTRLSGRDVITVKVDSPRFKVAGSTQVHLKTATKGGFTAGDVVVVRY
jgi:hypothetical protein